MANREKLDRLEFEHCHNATLGFLGAAIAFAIGANQTEYPFKIVFTVVAILFFIAALIFAYRWDKSYRFLKKRYE